MALYELINSAAWLLIIGLEVQWAMHWTCTKINDWKCFLCIALPHCCCGFCVLIKPFHIHNSTFTVCLPLLTNNADYWGKPELSTESSVGELGCPQCCKGQHSQADFSRVRTENPPEVFCEDNKPFLYANPLPFSVLVLMSTHAEAFPCPQHCSPWCYLVKMLTWQDPFPCFFASIYASV